MIGAMFGFLGAAALAVSIMLIGLFFTSLKLEEDEYQEIIDHLESHHP